MERGSLFGLIGLLLGTGSIVLIIAEVMIVVIGYGASETLPIAWTLIIIALIVSIVGVVLSIAGVKSNGSKLAKGGIAVCSLMALLIAVSFIELCFHLLGGL